MHTEKALRIVADIFMLPVLLMLMADHHTGNVIHECLGLFLACLVGLHTWCNGRWYTTLHKRLHTQYWFVAVCINLALAAIFIGTLVSAIPISQTLFTFMGLHGGISDQEVHLFCSHWMFILAGMHLGLYWKRFPGILRIKNRMSGYGKGAGLILILAAAYGVQALLVREWQFPLSLSSAFTPYDEADSFILLLLDNTAIFCLAVMITAVPASLIRKK